MNIFSKSLLTLSLAILPYSMALAQTPAPLATETIAQPQRLAPQARYEIVEVFGYSCIHCFQADGAVSAWKEGLPEGVTFVAIPAAFGGRWDVFARAYFAAESLRILDRVHRPIYEAIHVNRRIVRGSPEEVANFVASLNVGVTAEQFIQAMNSFAVEGRMQQARRYAEATGITGTPTFILNGERRVQNSGTSWEAMLESISAQIPE